MAQLYIDRGNTALKWQLLEDDVLLDSGFFKNDIDLETGLAFLTNKALSHLFVASVGSANFQRQLLAWAEEKNQPKPVFVESVRESCGVLNAYQEARQLGVDRWLAMIAAFNKYDGMLCIADSGTALTLDFLRGNGEHMGGFIVPGAELMKNSLLQNTQKIHVDHARQSDQLGQNTSEAVMFGIEQMLQIFVRETMAEIEKKHSQEITLVLTGGHSARLAEGFLGNAHVEKNLVLDGLKLVSQSYK
ncbi:MAG: type III pantothenate kinase [Cycloclasticus sp.]|nr:type III pantothenate kinase [Cycloclasticus sp.]MBG96549.1 type III pantothenate kinase [Cycloclasticus sp.]HAI96165.1 type III pantothenate kinase [Methylococcaceae bacterium]|tara:strand:+ start:1113 stop:1850 length:738 start_codon:yes stop_codon:yes gene_type:complete